MKLSYIVTALALSLSMTSISQAQLTQAANRAAITPDDLLNWQQFHVGQSTIASEPNPFFGTTTLGDAVTISYSSSGWFIDPVTIWSDVFDVHASADEQTLFDNVGASPVTLAFSSPISGFGTFIDGYNAGTSYTYTAAAYDASNALLGTVSVTGIDPGKTNPPSTTAFFLGFTSSQAVSEVVLSTDVTGGGPSPFAFNRVSLLSGGTSPAANGTPEPGSLALAVTSMGMLGAFAIKRRRRQQMGV